MATAADRGRARARTRRSRRRRWCRATVPSAGIATSSQSRSRLLGTRRRATCSAASPRSCCRGRASRFSRVASNSVEWSSGSTKSRSGSPAWSTRRTTSSCSRAVTRAVSYATVWTTVGGGGVGDVDDRQLGWPPRPPRPSAPRLRRARPRGRRTAGARCCPRRWRRAGRARRAARPRRRSRRRSTRSPSWTRTSVCPSVLTTSGSSTPASWTLVPVSLFVARTRSRARRPSVRARRRRRPALGEVVDDVGIAVPARRGRRRSRPRSTYHASRSSQDSGRRQVRAGVRRRARRPSRRRRSRPVPAWSEPPNDVPATKAAPRPTDCGERDEGAGDVRVTGGAGAWLDLRQLSWK